MAHWCYGSTWASLYGVLAGSLRRPHALYGLPLGATAWASGYVVLPAAGLYKPIWEYDAKTLAKDLSAHLAYGAGTGAAFWLLLRQGRGGSVASPGHSYSMSSSYSAVAMPVGKE